MPWEQAIRIRFGRHSKLLDAGLHFKIPFFDSVYVQTTRLRVTNLPMQTISTKDDKTVTISMALGYSITDIQQLFNTLYHPESTLSNICNGEISEYVSSHDLRDCRPVLLEKAVREKIEIFKDYGIRIDYFKVVGFANVRTYRLISDMYPNINPMDMEFKK